MNVSIVFPTCDLRRMIPHTTGFLDVPGWPRPEPDRDFVRAAGSIKEDNTWGLEGWVSERFYCQADRAVRFHEFPAIRLVGHQDHRDRPKALQLRIAKRSFFFDGVAVAKLEIGFQNVSGLHCDGHIVVDELLQCVTSLKIALPQLVGPRVSTKNSFDYPNMALAGSAISRFLTAATSSRVGLGEFEANKHRLKPGKPLLFFELDVDDPILVGQDYQQVKLDYPWHMELFHGRRRTLNRFDVPVWVLRKSRGLQPRFSNAARIFLVRLHCEHECLRAALDAIQRGEVCPSPRSIEADFLQNYLNRATRNIYNLGKKFRQSLKQLDAAIDAVDTVELWARASLDHIQAGDRSALHTRLKSLSIRRNIEIKALKYIEEDEDAAEYLVLNNYGSLVMADNRQTVSDSSNVFLNQAGRDAQVRLENSFSAAQGSAAKPDIVQSMADLKALIDNAIEKGQLGDPDAVARDFEDLANEVASKKPRKEKVQSAGAFILDGLKAAADIAKPAGSLIAAISSAFG